jgi:hypothetical protein
MGHRNGKKKKKRYTNRHYFNFNKGKEDHAIADGQDAGVCTSHMDLKNMLSFYNDRQK